MHTLRLALLCGLACCGTAARPEAGSLFVSRDGGSAASLFPAGAAAPSGSASLFIGQDGNSFFAPWPERAGESPVTLAGRTQTAQLLSLIAHAEAGPAGYDAVQYGATVRPPRRPTELTLAEIYAWIDATPGQPHAIGRYQFIPPTLKYVAREAGVPASARFSPEVQDRLAHVLLYQAGMTAFQRGELSRIDFMANLAKIWAGLPLPSGRSYYHGHAGNQATMSWAAFEGGMDRIFPR